MLASIRLTMLPTPQALLLLVASATTLVACGDAPKPTGPKDLVADPTVEQGCTVAPPVAGAVRAKHLVCDDEKVAGLLAAGRSGDILLENSRVRFVIRGPGEGFRLHGTTGGGLIDAVLHGREDQLLEVQPMLDWGAGDFKDVVITSSGQAGASEPDVAEVVVRGSLVSVPLLRSFVSLDAPDLILEQHYRLRPDTTHLEITTRAYRTSDDSPDVAGLRDLAFLGGALELFIPRAGLGPALGSKGRWVASEGGQSSYGFVYEEHPEAPLNVINLDGMALLAAIDLLTGASAESRHFIVGDGSVSSITDVAFPLTEQSVSSIAGSAPPHHMVAVMDTDDRPITRVQSDEDGIFDVVLPANTYRLQCVQEGTLPGPVVEVTLGESPVEGVAVVAGAGGQLDISVADADGSHMPARVMLTSAAGTQQVHVNAGTTSIPLQPGDYSVAVSRGIEYSLFSQETLTITDAETQVLGVVLEREVDTNGWIAVDSHLHSEMSTDSSIPLAERLLSVAGEGVEVAISTDHDYVTDYSLYVEQLGLANYLATQSGAEVSSSVVGHINGWPLEVRPEEAAAGAPRWYGEAPGQIGKLIRDGHDDRVVQINHPRRNSSSTFNAIELDPTTLTSLADPADLDMSGADFNDFDFDAIEVANAKEHDSFEQVFGDWLAFLAHGQRKSATGSSDSHSATAYSGRSRTYVWVGPGQDTPSEVDQGALNQALRQGRATVSQGAFVTIAIEDPVSNQSYGSGEVAPLQGQTQVALRVRVQAASWLAVHKLQIYQHDQLVLEQDLDELASQPVRFDEVINLPLQGGDSFFVARVESAVSASPVLPSPGPSFTNAVFADLDGDGLFGPLGP